MNRENKHSALGRQRPRMEPAAGRLNQAVAAICERAVWSAAGLPMTLKG